MAQRGREAFPNDNQSPPPGGSLAGRGRVGDPAPATTPDDVAPSPPVRTFPPTAGMRCLPRGVAGGRHITDESIPVFNARYSRTWHIAEAPCRHT